MDLSVTVSSLVGKLDWLLAILAFYWASTSQETGYPQNYAPHGERCYDGATRGLMAASNEYRLHDNSKRQLCLQRLACIRDTSREMLRLHCLVPVITFRAVTRLLRKQSRNHYQVARVHRYPGYPHQRLGHAIEGGSQTKI